MNMNRCPLSTQGFLFFFFHCYTSFTRDNLHEYARLYRYIMDIHPSLIGNKGQGMDANGHTSIV